MAARIRKSTGAWMLLLAVPAARAGVEWKSLPAEALSMTAPLVEKDAPAEVLFKEITLSLEDGKAEMTEYARIKVFTDKGRDAATVMVPYFGKDKIRQVSGRTIKPNGAIQEIAADSIFDRTVAKAGGMTVKVTSFALPNVEPGDIIEYHWKAQTVLYGRYPIDITGEFPAERVHVTIHNKLRYGYPAWVYIDLPTPTEHRGRDTSLEFENLPGLRKEPLALPEDMNHGWMLVSLHGVMELGYEAVEYERLKKALKVTGDIRRAAAEITSGKSSPEEKLRSIYEFCHTRIQNTSHADESAQGELAARKANHDPSDTLERKSGTGQDINYLYIALARAAGLEARWAEMPDGDRVIYDKTVMQDRYFFRAWDVAVRLDGKWRFFDPSTPELGFGMLRWQEEGQPAEIFDEQAREVDWVRTPFTPAASNACNRTATLRLAADGTIEGDIRVSYTGQLGFEKRERMARESQDQWQKSFIEGLQKRWKGAEVTGLQVDKPADGSKPLVVSYHLRITGYASRTGKRLFLQPAIFEAGDTPIFTAKTREQPVYYHYGWSEDEQYKITFPAGYALDHADRPSPVNAPGMGLAYEVRASVAGGSELNYHRTFTTGKGGWMLIPVSNYDQLKRALEVVQESDNHVVALKLAEVAQ